MRRLALPIVLAALLVPAASAETPGCFGAADRDPQRACHNPKLRLMVKPTPNRAAITPNLACSEQSVDQTLDQCAYGAAPEDAVETVVMVGDSHASHWRAALDHVAKARRWRVLEIGTPHCPFSRAVPKDSPGGDDEREWCPAWNDRLLAWLAEHPEIRTLITSSHTRAPIVVPEGADRFETRVDGFARIWAELPASIGRIVVIRDNPIDRLRTHDCVRRAIRDERSAGRRCRVPRAKALAPEPAIPAAARTTSRPVHVIDLTPHFCSARHCLPVVGGVLVHKDVDHLTQLFAKTLGPYLRRGVDAALAAG